MSRSPSSRSGIIVRIIGVDPIHALRLLVVGAIGSSEVDRLHALLRHQLHLHRAGRRRRLPCRAVQHRRRGPGLYRRAGLRAGHPGARPVPAGLADDPARHRRGRPVRRGLGRRAGLAAGLARQPHRHHHHHVQLRGLGADGLPDGERADRARLDDAAEPQLRAVRQAALDARYAGGHRHPRDALGAQSLDRAGRALLRGRLGVPVAHAVGLCAAHHGPQSRGGDLCRHQPQAHDHAGHVPLGRASRASSASTS